MGRVKTLLDPVQCRQKKGWAAILAFDGISKKQPFLFYYVFCPHTRNSDRRDNSDGIEKRCSSRLAMTPCIVPAQWAMIRVSLHWLLRCVDGCVKNVQLAHSDNARPREASNTFTYGYNNLSSTWIPTLRCGYLRI